VIPAVMPTYGRKDVVFERGQGSYLFAADGRRFLDFTSGIAVNLLGHCHPYMVKALQDQAKGANERARARIERRIGDVKADFAVRSKKLNQAWDLTKEALAA